LWHPFLLITGAGSGCDRRVGDIAAICGRHVPDSLISAHLELIPAMIAARGVRGALLHLSHRFR
jgi:hypothetical protein